MTGRNNSNEGPTRTPQYFHYHSANSYVNPLPEHENNEKFASDCVTSCARQWQNSSEQYHNFTNTLPSVEQILPQRTSFNFTSLQRSEDNYGSWIQSNELTGVNDTQHRFNDSSFSNNAANYFYCTVCYFCSADWCQVQNHLNTVHGENSYLTICQGMLMCKLISSTT
nr:hypothetical protein HmN_000183600 [Hymenolepis microstoma]